MEVTITACLTNWDLYQQGKRRDVYVKFPTTREEMQKVLKDVGVDGVRYRRVILTEYDSNLPGVCHHFSQYDSVDEVNYLARLLSELPDSELATFQAVLEYGVHDQGAGDMIDLALNLDCYELHPGVDSDEELGHIYLDSMGTLDVPEDVLPYFDYEAYGRDVRLNENGCFVEGGYLTKTNVQFQEQYHGPKDIPPEHRVFAYPKLTILEKMAAYKEVSGREAPDNIRPAPEQGHDDR